MWSWAHYYVNEIQLVFYLVGIAGFVVGSAHVVHWWRGIDKDGGLR